MGRPKGSWTGKANPNWKGGRRIAQGYVFLKYPEHPNATKAGYVREHVLVMSEHLGRAIQKSEVVHHINGIRNDNRLENLIVMTRSNHHSLHHKGVIKPESIKNLRTTTSDDMKKIWETSRKHERATPKVCDFCGKEFSKERRKGRGEYKHQFCDRKCFQDFRRANHQGALPVVSV